MSTEISGNDHFCETADQRDERYAEINRLEKIWVSGEEVEPETVEWLEHRLFQLTAGYLMNLSRP